VVPAQSAFPDTEGIIQQVSSFLVLILVPGKGKKSNRCHPELCPPHTRNPSLTPLGITEVHLEIEDSPGDRKPGVVSERVSLTYSHQVAIPISPQVLEIKRQNTHTETYKESEGRRRRRGEREKRREEEKRRRGEKRKELFRD
jgi:hypothetical protein